MTLITDLGSCPENVPERVVQFASVVDPEGFLVHYGRVGGYTRSEADSVRAVLAWSWEHLDLMSRRAGVRGDPGVNHAVVRQGLECRGDLAVVLGRGTQFSEPEGPKTFGVERRPAGTSWLALCPVEVQHQ